MGFPSSLQLLLSIRNKKKISVFRGGAITVFQLNLCPLSHVKLKVRAAGGGGEEGCKVTIESSNMKGDIYRTEIMRL